MLLDTYAGVMRDDAEVSLGRIEAAFMDAADRVAGQTGDRADGNERHKEDDSGNE
ncbi:MAG: hypothetical protein ACRDYA_04330 [Egibacteraceae bacterium]